jgi:hypothetical protein
LHDFLRSKVGLPVELIFAQTGMNFLYGAIGLGLFFSARYSWFKFLAWMNVIYFPICLAAAAVLLCQLNFFGSALLLVEGVFVGWLGRFELKQIRIQADHVSESTHR